MPSKAEQKLLKGGPEVDKARTQRWLKWNKHIREAKIPQAKRKYIKPPTNIGRRPNSARVEYTAPTGPPRGKQAVGKGGRGSMKDRSGLAEDILHKKNTVRKWLKPFTRSKKK